ncbi:MAG: PEP-CTERM sorting domain-containing protein [Puniceicoccales bacterium]
MNAHLTSIPLLTLSTLAVTLHGATVFEDDFNAGTTHWNAVSGYTSLSINTANVFGTGDALDGNVGTNSVNLLSTQFTQQTLNSIGDSISISFDYTWNGSSGASDRNPTFGLYSSEGTLTDYTDDVGYNIQVITASDPDSYRYYQDVNTDDNPLTGGTETQIDSSQNFNYDGTPRNFTLTLERIADTNSDSLDDLSISFSVTDPNNASNNASSAVVATNVVTFSYDEFLLRSRATNFYMDNVIVTSSIPEPGSFALIGGSLALGIVSLRRKRR